MGAHDTGCMTVIMKATGPADLLSLFPALLGFPPQNSIVLLAFRGTRTCGTLRVDLPSPQHPEVFARMALGAIGTVCKIPGADGVAFGVFTPEAFGGSASVPRHDFADVLLDRIADSGLDMKDALCRASDGWGSYLDGDVPNGGRSLTDLNDVPPDGLPPRPVDSDGRDLADRVPSAGAGQRRQMRDRLDALDAAIDRIEFLCRSHPDATDDQIDAMLSGESELVAPTLDFAKFAEAALTWTPRKLDDLGATLLWGITRLAMRDDTMLEWAFTPDEPAPNEAPRLSGRGAPTRSRRRIRSRTRARARRAAVVVNIGDRMTGFGPRPDPDRMLRAIDILLYLIARADDRDRLAPLCMVAWLNWGLGRASHAAKYIGEVRAIDPGYGMGEVLTGVFTVYPLPEWAFAEVDTSAVENGYTG